MQSFALADKLLKAAGACACGCLPASLLREKMSPERWETVLETVPKMKSLLCAAFPYATGREPEGYISRYARGKDYHQVLKKRLEPVISQLESLFPGHCFCYFADVSPFPEVWATAKAGLGKRGKNGLLITETAGSYVFLAFLATDAEIASTAGEIVSCCGCGKCTLVCPAGALAEDVPGARKARCLSGVTQRRGALTPEEQALLRDNEALWGCDRCQLCCPENEHLTAQPLPEFLPIQPMLPPEDLYLSDRAFRRKYAGRAFTWRGVAPLRRNGELLGIIHQEEQEKEKGKEKEQ